MKTLKDLQEKLEEEIYANARNDYKENEKIAQLKQGIIYLKDLNPTEEQVRRQYDKVKQELQILEERRSEWCITHDQHMSLSGVNTKDRRKVDAYYNKLHDIGKKTRQANFLEFILS